MDQLPIRDQANTSLEFVRVESGLLTGVPAPDPAIQMFKGVPFAAAPIGPLRWKAPQPPIAWACY